MPFPASPNVHAIGILILTLIALILFTREKIPLETSSLLVIVLLAVGFELFPYQIEGRQFYSINLFSGFGHEALIAVCALMIAGHALVRTGALEPIGRSLAKLWRISPLLSLLLTLIVVAVLSAFINNTPVVVLLLPILVSVSLRTNRSPSGVLMPMGFASLVGGMCTTIGTSTNLLVVSVAADMGVEKFSMFDFILPASIASVVGIVYLWLIAPMIVSERETPLSDTSPRIFLAQLHISEESRAIGSTLADLIGLTSGAMHVERIQRGKNIQLSLLPDLEIKQGDRLFVRDTPKQLKEFEDVLQATLYKDNKPFSDQEVQDNSQQQLAEIVVSQGSLLENTTLARMRFLDRYQLIVLALHRAGKEIENAHKDVSETRLQTGDVLLVQGEVDVLKELKSSGELLILDSTEDLPRSSKATLALWIMIGIVATAAFGILPIAISAVCGVLILMVTKCIDWEDATHALSTPIVLIVVASLAMGSALVATGGTEYLAKVFLYLTAGASAPAILSGLMLLMALLTNIVSNNAAAVIGTPVAVSIAQQLGLPAAPFILAVLFGANMSYITPMAYKTNLLVMNAGGYKFIDFVKVGTPLTIIMWLSYSWLLPWIYNL
jgi:di/tricarboxylate transporter